MTITVCPHGMGYPAACIDCLAEGPCAVSTGATEAAPEAERWTSARRPGVCPGCRDRIDVDDELGLVDGSWFCTGCVS